MVRGHPWLPRAARAPERRGARGSFAAPHQTHGGAGHVRVYQAGSGSGSGLGSSVATWCRRPRAAYFGNVLWLGATRYRLLFTPLCALDASKSCVAAPVSARAGAGACVRGGIQQHAHAAAPQPPSQPSPLVQGWCGWRAAQPSAARAAAARAYKLNVAAQQVEGCLAPDTARAVYGPAAVHHRRRPVLFAEIAGLRAVQHVRPVGRRSRVGRRGRGAWGWGTGRRWRRRRRRRWVPLACAAPVIAAAHAPACGPATRVRVRVRVASGQRGRALGAKGGQSSGPHALMQLGVARPSSGVARCVAIAMQPSLRHHRPVICPARLAVLGPVAVARVGLARAGVRIPDVDVDVAGMMMIMSGCARARVHAHVELHRRGERCSGPAAARRQKNEPWPRQHGGACLL